MQDRASDLGLTLTPREVAVDNYLGPITDSYQGFMKGAYARINPRHHRSILRTDFGNEFVDESVLRRRREDAAYAPQNTGFPQ
jgi:hypothetical protein